MTRYGYGYVPEKGFISFLSDLSEGVWNDISIKPYDHPEQKLAPTLLQGSSPPLRWKLRATWAITTLRDAVGAGPAVLDQLDVDWDSTQRKLHFILGGAGEDKNPSRRDAAERLRGALLLGNGTAQTLLSWDEEVDFGRQQLALTAEGPLADDSRRLGLHAVLKEVEETTEALARGLGRSPEQKRGVARSIRLRSALAGCAAAFNGIHHEIAWFLDHTEDGDTRVRIEQMLAPFQALLDRYPSTSSTNTGNAAPASAPAPAPAVSPTG
jgi:hypothetical protein